MFIITNMSQSPLMIDGVSISPRQQLRVVNLSDEMVAARNAGSLRVLSAETTLAERKADTAAFKPFKTGDPAIDG